MAVTTETKDIDFGDDLGVVNGADPVMDAYIARLETAVPKVLRRLSLMGGPEVEAELAGWQSRFDALAPQSVHQVLGHPFFSYYWRQLMLACVRKDTDFIRAWSSCFGHFVALPYLQGPGQGEDLELRLPEPGTELWLPGHSAHLRFDQPVERVLIAETGDGTVRDGLLSLPVGFITGDGSGTLGATLRVPHPRIPGTGIEIGADHPWIARHFASMNSHEPQPGYPASDLTVRETGSEDVERIGSAFALIEEAWPELAAEIRAYVRLFVPYGSDFHSSFTEACLMGAIFLSEAARPFTSRQYTAEHLLHEASHLRLMLLLELDPLVTCRDEAVFNSPVRKDPRPLWGMLQAIFVFARITAFHRRAYAVTGDDFHRDAQRENAKLLAQGMDEIEAEPSTSFTQTGTRLWEQMRRETVVEA
ncbi:aKG-HExxH-type peptide beta-hydroxylase [Streptomyces sp. WM6368]|uniref:aKG-HExxH-type peptide beta-hydroxylase n=1 Tax=Streptomyces sp. WM6368 TaxID=1415554 RepID=UPI0006AEC8CF|nr:HEXXH motif-containing putative peptide modification protein [Streptomyces sp. WM6368]KOU22203.1 hypothetical protein ADK51_20610 [Streptomyces sp. WM6368]